LITQWIINIIYCQLFVNFLQSRPFQSLP